MKKSAKGKLAGDSALFCEETEGLGGVLILREDKFIFAGLWTGLAVASTPADTASNPRARAGNMIEEQKGRCAGL